MRFIFLGGAVLSLPIPDVLAVNDEGGFVDRLREDPLAFGVFTCGNRERGFSLVRMIRGAGVSNSLYCLMFGPEADHVMVAALLNAGADQAERFPVDPILFRAQVEAIRRRGTGAPDPLIRIGELTFDTITRALRAPAGRVHLSETESRILFTIITNAGKPMSKDEILGKIYGFDDQSPDSKIIDVLICKIRKKIIKVSGGVDYIQTIWGRGYLFVPEGFRPQYRTTTMRYLQRIEGESDRHRRSNSRVGESTE